MFARAGISSRVLRGGESTGGFFGRPKKKKKEKHKFRCYMPFMWSACVAVCGGLFVLAGGTAMCVTGYFAKNFTSVDVTNGTHTWQEVDHVPYALMWNMTYVGPVLMGCGCFAIVVACVVVCETRDKMLRIMEADEKEGKKTKTKPDFYDLVIKKLRKNEPVMEMQVTVPQPPPPAAPSRRKSLFNLLMRKSSLKSIKSTKSDFAHIGNALRRIPMQIFAIDMSQSQKMSLLPISSTLGGNMAFKRPSMQDDDSLYLFPKYPSASCIQDLLKLNEDKLVFLFPDMSAWLNEVLPRSTKIRMKSLSSTFSKSLTYDLDKDSDCESLVSVTVHSERGSSSEKTVKPAENDLDLKGPTSDTNRATETNKGDSNTGPASGKRTLRGTLLRQKPVTDENHPLSFPANSRPPGSSPTEQTSQTSTKSTPSCDSRPIPDKNTVASPGSSNSKSVNPQQSQATISGVNPVFVGDTPPLTSNSSFPPFSQRKEGDNKGSASCDIPRCESSSSLVIPETDTRHSDTQRLLTKKDCSAPLEVRHPKIAQKVRKNSSTTSSIFVPYTPRSSNARHNSKTMLNSKPMARSLNHVDAAVFSLLRSSSKKQMTSFTRHSEFRVEKETSPSKRPGLRKSKTMVDIDKTSTS